MIANLDNRVEVLFTVCYRNVEESFGQSRLVFYSSHGFPLVRETKVSRWVTETTVGVRYKFPKIQMEGLSL